MAEFAATQLMYKNSCAFSQTTSPSETPLLNQLGNMTVQKSTASSPGHTSNVMASGISVPKGRMVWPSPPLAPTDVETNYYVQDFTIPCNCLAAECTYSTASPNDGWCASVPTLNQPSEQYQAQGMSGNVQDLTNTCTPSPSADLGLDSSDGFLLALHCDNGDASSHLWGVDITPSMSTFGNSPASQSDSAADSPVSMDTPKNTTTANRQKSRSVPSSASPPSDATESGETEKPDEPYAKLIYKAIMTRPNYSMTLQEIYQWFREHTTKAVTETGGWQNSIRHNLSMNAAFRKRDKVVSKAPRNLSSTTEESKRVNEWVLEDWAIRDGVQSTTRYRQKTYAKRAGSAGRSGIEGWAVEHSVKRALSGRKGGCATRAARVGRTSSSSYGQVMQFPQHSRQVLDFRPVSPTYASVADIYGMRPALPGQYTAMPQYTSLDAYREGIMDGCGGDAISEPPQLRPADSNSQQTMANNNNMNSNSNSNSNAHHANHTASCDEATAQGRRTPAMDMVFDASQVQRHAGVKYEDAEACVSTLPTCRPYQPLQGSPYIWWDQAGQ